MPPLPLAEPLVFEPVFMERVWGGRQLETRYGKKLPPNVRIGESWEIVDRAEAQSVVRNGTWRGCTLHQLWTEHRREVFAGLAAAPRFPLLVKLIDAREKLSVQVHPPSKVAHEFGGEAKTEFWYIAEAAPGAELYVGLRKQCARPDFERALRAGDVAEFIHRTPVKTGEAMFLPSGRVHAIGAGNLIVEIQQNSDTTYRVFDWNRSDTESKPRELHIEEALRCIDFEDCRPALTRPAGELLVRHSLFEVQKWNLDSERAVAPEGEFAIVFCLSGAISCAGVSLKPGGFFLVPSSLSDRLLKPLLHGTELLRVTIPRINL